MPGKREILGIYLGDTGIEFHCLRGGIGGWKSVPLSVPVPERGRASTEDLKRLLGSFRPSGSRTICIGLPRKAFFLREIPFPELEPEEAENAVRLGIGLHAHMDPDSLYFDQYAFRRRDSTTVLLAYIPRHFLDPFLRVVHETGHGKSLGAISPATLGLDILLREGLGPSPPCLMAGNQGGSLVLSLHGEEGWEGAHVVSTEDQSNLAENLDETLSCLPEPFSKADLPVYWMGDKTLCPDPIRERFEVFDKISALGHASLEPTWGLCSAALAFINYPALSLQPTPRKRPWRMRLRTYQLIAGATAAVLLLTTGYNGIRLYSLSSRLSTLDTRVISLEKRLEPLQKTKDELENIQAQLSDILDFKSENARVLDILKNLAELTPTDTWIKTLSLKSDKLRVSAEGKSAVDTLSAWRNSPLFAEVKLISPVTKSRTQMERFSVEIILAESKDTEGK